MVLMVALAVAWAWSHVLVVAIVVVVLVKGLWPPYWILASPCVEVPLAQLHSGVHHLGLRCQGVHVWLGATLGLAYIVGCTGGPLAISGIVVVRRCSVPCADGGW